MRFGHILKMRLRSLFGRTRVEDEVRRELEVHLEQLIRYKRQRVCQPRMPERPHCVTSGISGSGRSSRGMSAACGISMISPTISRSPFGCCGSRRLLRRSRCFSRGRNRREYSDFYVDQTVVSGQACSAESRGHRAGYPFRRQWGS